MTFDEFIPIIEALLFASGEALSLKQIAKSIDLSFSETEDMMDKLICKFKEDNRGICIIKINEKYQMCSNPKYAEYIKLALNVHQPSLSTSAMEVLSIIAYNEPVTKSFIQNIRGVDSSGTVNSLIEKDLIKESGRLDIPGKPIVYSTTDNFLKCFGLTTLKDLPEISNVRN